MARDTLSRPAAKPCSSLEACSPAAVADSVRLLRAEVSRADVSWAEVCRAEVSEVSKYEGSKVEDSKAEGSKAADPRPGSAEYEGPRAGCAAGTSEALLARPKSVTGARSLEKASAGEQHARQQRLVAWTSQEAGACRAACWGVQRHEDGTYRALCACQCRPMQVQDPLSTQAVVQHSRLQSRRPAGCSHAI